MLLWRTIVESQPQTSTLVVKIVGLYVVCHVLSIFALFIPLAAINVVTGPSWIRSIPAMLEAVGSGVVIPYLAGMWDVRAHPRDALPAVITLGSVLALISVAGWIMIWGFVVPSKIWIPLWAVTSPFPRLAVTMAAVIIGRAGRAARRFERP